MPWQMTSFSDVQHDFGIALVAQRRRVRAVVDHVLVGDPVELVGGDARRDGLARLGQCRRPRSGPATRIFSITSGVCTHGSVPSRAVGFHAYSGRAIDLGTGRVGDSTPDEVRCEQAWRQPNRRSTATAVGRGRHCDLRGPQMVTEQRPPCRSHVVQRPSAGRDPVR